MMQNMLHYQFTVRNQRKGFTVKQVLQFSLLLAVGIWLLYQIKNSHNESQNNNYGGISHIKLAKEQDSNCLGRRGSPGWSNHSIDSDLNAETSLNKDDENGIGELIVKGHKRNEENISSAISENDKNEVTIEKKLKIPAQQDLDHSEMRDIGLYSFPDENGIPQDFRDESSQIEETESDNESGMVQSIVVEDKDVNMKERRITTYAENRGKGMKS